ncbi:hypothetical protein LSCM4_04122 [Leishmania orientalis]|uniref:Calpain catalytic domain-containing protein n=1 Tax=Leishmania orientalis TaxID=2249476 RepID=A0A836HET3_9TRYP|nr:hypothetical protein LSCM4_04122 [Leishmania orientalis]
MNDRAHELALEQKWANRDKVLDAEPEGVPLRCVPLDEDPAFVALEGEWRGLMQDPQRNAKALRDLEGRMNDRAHELALEQKWANRDKVLDAEPEGVPLRCVPLDEDPAFVALEGEWRGLMQDPQRNAKALRDLEGRMNDRAHELALEQKWANRDKVLDAEPEGVPLRCVPLDEDPAFVALEGEWRGLDAGPAAEREGAEGPGGEDERPRARARAGAEVGEPRQGAGRGAGGRAAALRPPGRGPCVCGAGGRVARPDAGPAAEREGAEGPGGEDERPRARARAGAEVGEPRQGAGRGAGGRAAALRPPGRGPCVCGAGGGRVARPDAGPAAEREGAEGPGGEDERPRARARAGAEVGEPRQGAGRGAGGRAAALRPPGRGPCVCGAGGRVAQPDAGPAAEREGAEGPGGEDERPRARARAGAEVGEPRQGAGRGAGGRAAALRPPGRGPCVCGAGGRVARPDAGPAAEREGAEGPGGEDERPRARARAGAEVGEPRQGAGRGAGGRAAALRPPGRGPCVCGAGGRVARPDAGPAAEREGAEGPGGEDERPRARARAGAEVGEPRQGAGRGAGGRAAALRPLDEDPAFVALEGEWRGLMQDPQRNAKALRDLEGRMNDRAHELALEQKWANRDKVLDAEPEGVPLRCVPLDEDPAFVALEGEWRSLMQDPQRNAKALRDLEGRMNDRAHELALEQKWANRDKVLDAEPEGVPLRCVPLDEDPAFVALEGEWRGLMQDPQRNAKALRDLEGRMNDRAHELALEQKWANRDKVLDAEPEGVPLRCVPLDEDPAFVALEGEWRSLMQDPQRNAKALRDLEGRMNDRAHELALEQKWANRDKVLDAEPEGVPLRCVPLDEDPAFVALEGEWRGLMQDPQRNAKIIVSEDMMHERAAKLAKDMHTKERAHLDPEPEGVPLDLLPLNEDAVFSRWEDELRGLHRKPKRDVKAIKDLQKKLNDRAHELAGGLKSDERELFLDPVPLGIPVADLPLETDPDFHVKEIERLQLRKEDPLGKRDDIKALEDALNERARELAKDQHANQRAFLDQDPYGVPLEKLGLDYNDDFLRRESELCALQKDPRRNAKAIADLKGDMRDMVNALAAAEAARDRSFLDPEVEGRLLQSIPLLENPEFKELDTKRRRLLYRGGDMSKVPDMEDRMNDIAIEIAHVMNVAERPDYMDTAYKGIPVEDLPLDEDHLFHSLEVRRQQQKQDPRRNARGITDTEQELNDRAMELATEKLKSDRNYLDPEPEGVPLRLVPLDIDVAFTEMEAQRAKLKKDLRRNTRPIADLEDQLNDRAHGLAKALKEKERPKFLDARFSGIPYTELPLDADQPFRDMEVQRLLLKEQPHKNATAIQDLEEALSDRAGELAKDKLEDAPQNIPLKYIPLDKDKEFGKMEAQRMMLRAQNQGARAPSQRVRELEDAMNQHANEMAKALKQQVRANVLPPRVGGIARDALQLDDDVPFTDLEVAHIAANGDGDLDKGRDLCDAMQKRAIDVAAKLRGEERANLGNPLGFSPEDLPLESSPEYLQKEAVLVEMRASPKKNLQAIKVEEESLYALVMELAKEKAAEEREDYIDPEPEGRRLSDLGFDDDPTFVGIEEQYHRSKKDPYADQDRLHDLEQMMNDRAHVLAKMKNAKDREMYLESAPRNVPVAELPLDTDPHFHELEDMYRDAKNNPTMAKKASQLLAQMNERAKEIAQAVHDKERRPLNQHPNGIPLETLPLNEDPVFNALENEARALRNAPSSGNKSADKLADIVDRLNARAEELANAARKQYVDATPEGVPMELLTLGDDASFLEAEEELRRLEKNPVANRQGVRDLKEELNFMAHEKAKRLLQGDRAYLDQNPEGVDLCHVPLDSDPEFHELETRRAKLKSKDLRAHQKAITTLEDQLNSRAHELAREVKEGEVRALEPDPHGIPYAVIVPHNDDQFNELAKHLRNLKTDPKRNAAAIKETRDRMNDRGAELAEAMLKQDRSYLEEQPAGVPLQYLPLNSDSQFNRMEVERAKLKARDPFKNTKKIHELEDQLNARAVQLAEAQKQEDLRGLDPKPEGISLAVIDPHSDAKFAALLPQLRDLKADPRMRSEQLQQLVAAMNNRAHELAREMLRGDRPAYLEEAAKGVPLDLLPLDTDPQFHDMEVQRAVLKAQDLRRNAAKMKDVEDRLRERANELAEQQRARDLQNLNQVPEGLPMALVNPHDDPTFATMVNQHRQLAKESKKNAEPLAKLEEKMNDRVHELAREMLERDNTFLDPAPQGVSLAELPLSTDEEFHRLEVERAKLKAQDPRRNAAKIRDMEAHMNNRVHELALEQLTEDLRGVDQAPRGLPVELLSPHADSEFAEAAKQIRKLKKSPAADPEALQAVLNEMNDRVRAMADEAMDRDYLDPEPEGVPLTDLPLSSDPEFHGMEVERARLKLKDAKRNARAIKDLEQRLNDHAHELAKRQLEDDLAGCDSAPQGIPLALLKPTEDPKFAGMIPQLRALKKEPAKNAEAIQDLEKQMNDRAYELADQLLERGRGYLESKPEGVALEYLSLDKDLEFTEMEVERAKLKAQDPRRNQRRIADLEDKLNDRAAELAAAKKAEELAHFLPQYNGIETVAMRPHDDPEFGVLVDQLRKLEKAGHGASSEAQKVLQDMDTRLDELAKEKVEGDLWFLDKEPEGIPLEEVATESDPTFQQLRQERANLKATDPRKNADKIKSLEGQMGDRAHDLAKEMKKSDFDGVDSNPLGIPLELLQPRDDPQVARVLPELRRAKASPRDAQKAQNLLNEVNNRIYELAQSALSGERPTYLDPNPEGVPLSDLPLDTDGIYNGLEVERAKLVLTNPMKNAKQIEDLEDRLNERAHELAQQILKDDLRNVDPTPQGIPIEAVKPHNNPDFHELATRARELRKDPRRNADKLAAIKERMNEVVNRMAAEMLGNHRDYLDPEPEGVPVEVVPLDEDPEFHAMEVQRAVLAAQDPVKNRQAIADLEERLNVCAHELADAQKREDLHGLSSAPLGVPVSLLNPHEDQQFAAKLPELRALKKDGSQRSQSRLNDTLAMLDDILEELAADYLEEDRAQYLEPFPQGIPVTALPLYTDPEFRQLEAERLDLISRNPKANKDAIRDLEAALNERAHELAREHRKNDRGYLDPEPLGIPIDVLPLDTDRQFSDLEAKRATLKAKDPIKNAAVIHDLEDQLNDRAIQLAEEQITEDLRAVDSMPEDIPVRMLKPHEDPEFARMVNALRFLKADSSADPKKVSDLEQDMNDRVHELAEDALAGDRSAYLDLKPEGIAVVSLPLDSDPLYHRLEVERAKLVLQDPKKNQAKIADLEDRLNDRARELAKEQRARDLEDLNEAPRGIPLELLQPHDDDTFALLAAQRRDANSAPKESCDDLEDKLNDRAHELAKEALSGDRGYLDPEPKGVPLADLPLDDDLQFHQMEVERAKLKAQDLKKNAERIKDLEDKLNDRAEELAEAQKKEDLRSLDGKPRGIPLESLNPHDDAEFASHLPELRRLKSEQPNHPKIKELQAKLDNRANELAKAQVDRDRAFLDPEPEGIPLTQLPLDSDRPFTDLEKQLRQAKQDPKRNAEKIASLQEYMNERAHDLARDLLKGDRGYLDPEPENVPITDVPIDADAEFRELEAQRAKLKEDPRRNADTIKDLEDRLNSRAHALAKALKEAARSFLNAEPEGMAIADLPLDADKDFAALEAERRRRVKDPRAAKRNKDVVRDLEEKMNDRAHQLAKDEFAKQRHFMDQEPEGVPLERLPLDIDPEFKDVEMTLHKAKKDPHADPKRVAALEKRMNDRAHELARAELAKDRAFLDPEPEGVPLADLPLSDDPEFNNLAKLRQTLKNNRRSRDPEVRDLEDKMNDRVHTLAKDFLNKNRSYLNPEPEGVPLERLALSEDKEFHEMERELRALKKQPAKNKDAVEDLEERMNDRAHELAKEYLAKDRDYLEKEPLGVPVEELPLNEDSAFREMEEKRRALKKDARGCAKAIKELEDRLNGRAEQLAQQRLDKDRAFLDIKPEGILVKDLPLDKDKAFRDMERQLRQLRKDPRKNVNAIRDMEEDMNHRAHTLAKRQLADDRNFLNPEPRGVPLVDLALDDDEEFRKTELARREAKKDPKNAAKVRELETVLNEHAERIASEYLKRDRAYLDPEPEGVALEELPLDTDPDFHGMEVDRRKLNKDPGTGSPTAEVRAIEKKMNSRARELAKGMLEGDRGYLSRNPEGVPLEVLPLDTDVVFHAMEVERATAKKSPGRSADVLREEEAALNDRAFEVARRLLEGDRDSYLDPRPRGVPLEDLPLDKDDVFHDLEVERATLKITDPIHNAAAVHSTESMLNDRAYQLAVQVMKEDLANFPPSYHGIPTADLEPHSDRLFREAAEMRRLRMRDPTVALNENVEQIMEDRLNELARERKEGNLYFMDPSPAGVPLSDVPLSSDKSFNDMLQERQQLRENDPMAHRKAIAALEDKMRNRAAEIARNVLNSDFDGVDKLPFGIPLDLLEPRQDAEVARLIQELRRWKRSPQLKNRVVELQAKLNERVHALAAAALEEGRDTYLDFHPEDVPLELLPLRTDDAFHEKEVQRAILHLQDPAKHADRIAQLEQELSVRVHELALSQKEEDLRGVDATPRGLPLAILQPHTDAKMHDLIKVVRVLKADPVHNAENIRWQQQQMGERARELATMALNGDREYLMPTPLGVSLTLLPLDDDAAFQKAEVARAVKKRQADPSSDEIARLEEQLNARAKELAEEQLRLDVEGLEQAPLGVPLSLLKPHADRAFEELLPELRRLEKDPAKNAAKLQQLRSAANERNYELAEGFLAKDHISYIDAEPEGVPLDLVPVAEDEHFKALENKRLQLLSAQEAGHAVNAKELEALTAQLRERAHEVAKLLLRKDRGYLDPLPEGVPLDVLPLDSDAAFRRLEASRLAAKGRNANTLLKHLEDQLNARAHKLALAQKEEDLRELNQHPHDLPLTLLQPHQDALFGQWVDELRRLKASPGDQRKAIKEVIGRMNERGFAMAESVTKGDRRYLHPKPANVPLSRLSLDADAAFHALEMERAKLKLTDPWKNQHRIADLEDHLNSRAAELAMAVKTTDLKSLAPTLRGIPVELLNLHEDPKFEALIAEKEKLPRGCSAEAVTMLLCSMNDCAMKAADKLLLGDRGYLDQEVEGVPLAHLPLDTDTDFHEMEVERAVLKARDPVKNSFIVNDLEDQLKKRAHELANAALAMDRDYLIPMPEGVPIEELPLNTDSKFHSMEVERARLRVREAEGNVARVQELEGRLNDRAAGLARKQLEEDLQGLDREPEGYPLKYLRLHTDAVFAAEVVRLRRAKMDPVGDAMRVREIQATLNARAHALARERIVADRARLDQEPNKVPLVLLPLDKDARFVALEKELRMLKAAEKQSSKTIAEAEGRMNDRAHVLAKEFLKQSRGFLAPELEGVSLAEVPLDDDAEFSARETDRLRLLARGVPLSSSQLRAIEEQLNERAHQLAAKLKAKGREFLRSKSSDIPKELLALDEDMAFVAKEKELRKLLLHQPDAPHFSLAAANLRRELQLRADEVGEAQLRGDREKYLDVQPEGVDLCDIPLDTDHIYHQVEVERAILRTQGATGRDSAVAALEKKLNARAHELAHEIVVGDRDYLPKEMHGIPVEELPLDTDARFKELERQRRAHKRSPNMRKEVVADEEELRNHALELANEVIALDLEPIKAFYRGIPKEELNLHADSAFRELAKRRRWHRGKGGRVEAKEMTAIEDEMDRRAGEIADDVIDKERAFLDPEPEGMYLIEVPLDDDPTFQKLEHEYRRRCKDPLATKQNGDVLRELAEEMNQRSHTLARAAFARIRDFMESEPEGIPLEELGLDEDPEFKEAEIARYRTNRSSAPDAAMVTEMELRMDRRARELARATLAADRAFLDPKPEGVSLEALPLDTDKEFGDLARERRRHKKTLKGGMGEAEVRAVEEKMNARSHEMAKEFLQAERAFLSREPEGVPLDDLPLNTDPLFRAMEDKRLQWKRDLLANATMRATKEAELEERAHVIAKELLRKERAFLDPEPLGVPLEELPLNYDSVLNPVERKRRALRMHSKRNHEAIRACEEQMVDRVLQIAATFVEKERAFLDQNPEGVPLRYLPLNTDREFHDKELHRRKLLQRCERNRGEIADTERKMNERVHALAKDLVLKGRAFLHAEPCGVPIGDVPLNEDEQFRKMEEKRRALKEAGRSTAAVKAIEEKLNDRAEVLAQRLLDEERAFMDGTPLGIPLHDLPLNTDRRMREIERTRRQLRKSDPEGGVVDIEVLEAGMNARAYELADQLLRNDRGYLHPEPRGVPLADLPLHTDRIFHKTELARFRAKKDGQTNLVPMENELNKRAMELAAEFIRMERAYLDQEVEGVALERLQLDTDPTFHKLEQERRRLKRSGENPPLVLELEHLLNLRAHELAMELRGWQDPEFHARNEHVAEQWVRVCELYPEGRYEPFEPAAPAPGDVVSAPRDVGFLAPFIAALSRHPVLLQRLIATKEAPVNAPYTFVFFDPHSNPVYIDVDDRVPCTQEHEPKFLQSSYRQWYPLLLEKAYAKFVGGYERLVNCTSLETLRDLTGRPVTHTPFDLELAEAANLGRYTSVDFWLRVAEDMARGDVVLCSSNAKVPDGIHPLCSYALVGVVVTLEGSTNPSDVVIKLENSYRNDEPVYTGPLCHVDVNWSQALQRVCQYDHGRDDVLYLPLPTFLRNFSSMQTCRINCGDRLTATGAWDSRTSGGSAKFTSFRNNPVFVLQNSSSRPATVISELRHASPLFVDPDGASHYLPSGVVLMEPTSASAPLTPLITNSTARILQRGIMLDSREVCSTMEIPANSTCLLIPYTAKVGQHGSFFLSVYPGCAKISLAPLHYCGLSREPKSTAVTLTPGAEGQRVDFTVSSACDVHVLLRQEKMIDLLAAVEGDAIADDDVVMVAFSDQAMKLTSSGEATNAREHSLVFRAEKPGYYSLLLTSPNQSVSGDNPCTVSIFTPKRVLVKFVPPPAGARPLQQTRLPTLPQRITKNTCTTNPRRLPVSIAARQSQQRQRKDSLPPLRSKDASTLSPGPVSHSVLFSCSF